MQGPLDLNDNLTIAVRDPAPEDILDVRQPYTAVHLGCFAQFFKKCPRDERVSWCFVIRRASKDKKHVVIIWGDLNFFFFTSLSFFLKDTGIVVDFLPGAIEYADDKVSVNLADFPNRGFERVERFVFVRQDDIRAIVLHPGVTSVVDYGKCIAPCSTIVLYPFLCSSEHGLKALVISILLLGDLSKIKVEVLDLLMEVIDVICDFRQIGYALILLISEHSVISVANY